MGSSRLADLAARLWKDEQGQAGLEFVVTLPLLVGVATIAAEYGEGLQKRALLDSAVREATRLLSRAPGEISYGISEIGARVRIHAPFVFAARSLVAERMNMPAEDIDFGIEIVVVDEGENFRGGYYVITVDASIDISMPLLGLFDIDETTDRVDADGVLNIRSSESARYLADDLGSNRPGDRGCAALSASAEPCA